MSVTVLREDGPLDLREITRRTAKRLDFGSLYYDDVEAVLFAARERGEVKVLHGAEDRREVVWAAA